MGRERCRVPAPWAGGGGGSEENALTGGKKIASLETDKNNRCTDDFAELVTVPGVRPHDGGGLSDRRRRVGVAVVGDGVDDDDRRRRLRQRGHCLRTRGAHDTSALGRAGTVLKRPLGAVARHCGRRGHATTRTTRPQPHFTTGDGTPTKWRRR